MAENVVSNVIIRINDKDVVNSYKGINKEVKKLEGELRGITRGTDEWNKKASEVEQARKHFEKVKNEINAVQGSLKKAEGTLGSFKTIAAGFLAGDFLSNGIQSVMQFGRELTQRIDELRQVKTELVSLDKSLKGKALDTAAAKLKAISDTYGKSTDELKSAVKGLNTLTGDTNKSLDLIKKGFVSGADASGEMLAQLREYPTMMKDAKVSAEEMIAIIAGSEKLGVYDDKGIDAIKEGMLRVREGVKSTKDAMAALGIDVPEIYRKISSGAMSYFDVLKVISGKLKETGADSRITGTAIADIFGGPGEDAGYEYLSMLKDIDTNLNNLTKSTDENIIAKEKELEANEKLNGIWVQLTGTGSSLNKAYSAIKSGLADMLGWMFKIKEAKLSDEYLQQQNRLIYLKSQLDANIGSEEKRVKIIRQIKTEFPDYFKGLSQEETSHLKIARAINATIDALGKKYKMQVLQEGMDKEALDFQGKYADATNKELEVQREIERLNGKYNKQLKENGFKFKSGTAVNQATELVAALKKIEGASPMSGFFTEADWVGLQAAGAQLRELNIISGKADAMMKKRQAERIQYMNKNGLTDDTVTTTPSKDTDFDANTATKKADTKASKDAESAQKKAEADRKKENEARQKELEESIKAAAEANNSSIELETQFRINKLKLQEDSLQKELALADLERSKELNAQRKQQDEILKDIADLENKIANAKSPEAKANFEKSLADKRNLIQTHDQIVLLDEETHQLRLKAIREKWSAKDFEDYVKAEQRKIEESRRLDEDAINNISTMEDAEKALSQMKYLKLTDTELRGIRTLEDAKRALREDADRKMLAAQLVSLEANKKIMEERLVGLTGPAAEQLKADLDTLTTKITGLKGAINGGTEADAKKVQEENAAAKEKIDILGFSAKDWEDSFSNLDTTAGKIKVAQMAVQALTNAFAMFGQLQENLNKREMASFDKDQNKKKKDLLKQLNQGLINQEEYNKSLQLLDAQKANKEAELAYKQAKMQRTVQIASAIASTALGITSALTMQPWSPANFILAGVVGAIGAAQIGVIASQPLPERPSYASGGFTGGGFGSPDNSGFKPAGIVHENEWVAPRWMTENPRTAKVIDYLESVRMGKTKPMATGGFVEENKPVILQNTTPQNTSNDVQLITVLSQLSDILEYLKNNGVDAWMVENEENGKRLKRAIKKFETIENRASGK